MQRNKEIDECVGIANDAIVILETISRGELFRVLKARRGTKLVTLKVANTADAMFTELLRREYELGCSLSHACIASTLGFEEQTELGAAIVMEYVEGVTLDEFIASHPDRSVRERVLCDILDGVEYLHHRGIMHNDLKPQNIIINRHGAARIIDFGLSISDDSLWSGFVGGSKSFSAPEIVQGGGAVGTASDIYSVGRLMEHIFEGRRYGRIVRRATATEAEHRYDSIASLRRAIMRYRRRPMVVAAVGVFVVTLLAIAIPHLQTAVESSRHTTYRTESAELLNDYYKTLLHDVEENRYTEFAAMARGIYMLRFQEYRNSLPSERHLAAEEIFVGHIRAFDSMIVALPSIHSLPAPQRERLMARLDSIALQIK